MAHKQKKESISIRIPQDYYEKLKGLAINNKRPVVTELTIILDDYLESTVELVAARRLKALAKVQGIIKNLPRKNYSQTIDKELYED